MSQDLYTDWIKEVQKSLKVETLPLFEKKISNGQSISPFSVGRSDAFFQRDTLSTDSFLAIQNYSELVSGEMRDWVQHPDVGLRFRQLDDIPQDKVLHGKKLFLSQPYLFVPNEQQKEIIEFIENENAIVNLGWSPLSFGLTRGEILKKPLKGLDKIADCNFLRTDSSQWFYLSSAPYQWAGAEPHAELGILLSMVAEIMAEADVYKIPASMMLKKMSFGLAIGTDIVVEPAKIISLKVLMQRLVEIYDNDLDFIAPPIYAMPSLRLYSGRQPWNNLIRSVLMCSSAIIGGAQGFKCIPYDVLSSEKKKNALRESTNVPLLLRHEARLQTVHNPLDGASLYANSIEALCKMGWDFFKEIEKKGGIFEAVRTGWLQRELLRQSEDSVMRVKRLDSVIVGVNDFVDKRFVYSSSTKDKSSLVPLNNIIDPLFLDKTDDEYMSVQPLVISSLTYDWEKLQEKVSLVQPLPIVVVKVPSPGAEKKFRILKKVLDVLGCDCIVIEEKQIPEKVVLGTLSVLIVNDMQQEQLLLSQIQPIVGAQTLSFLSEARATAHRHMGEGEAPFSIAEKIVALLMEIQ